MKIFVNDLVIDTANHDTPVIIIFEDDEERIQHGNNISHMPMKDGKRVYTMFSGISPDDLHTRIIEALCKY